MEKLKIRDIILVVEDDLKHPDPDFKEFAFLRDTGQVIGAIYHDGAFKAFDEYAPMFNEENGHLTCKPLKWIGTDEKFELHVFSKLSDASKIDIASQVQMIKFKI